MRSTLWHSLALSLFFLLLSSAPGQSPQQKPARSPESDLVARVADEYWQHLLKNEAYFSLAAGTPVVDLPDFSERKLEANAAFGRHILAELEHLKPSSLSHEDLLTVEMLRWQQRQEIEWARFYWLQFQITPSGSQMTVVQRIFAAHPFRNKADLDHYIALLEKCPAFVNATLSHLHKQAEMGIVLSRDEFPIVNGFWSAYLKEPQASPFFVAEKRLSALEPALVGPFQKKVAEIIESQINPALHKLLDYLGGDYASKAPEAVGVGQYPMGKEYYRFLVRFCTTLDISPEEVHSLGLAGVEQAEARMAELRGSVGFKGTREEFHNFLRTDPRFVAKSADQIESRIMFYMHRVEPVLGKYFLKIPRAPYAVKRLDSKLESSQALGHFEPPDANQPMGIYYYNGAHPGDHSLAFLGALALHELMPGHHFQASVVMENAALPAFRRQPWFVAYTEGWGDYSAFLGQEMGVYEDAYDTYGMMAADLRKSVRLVVDTGMNYMGWSRGKAIEYMRLHLLDSDAYIQTESLRYSVDFPGQALGYKMGTREFIALREKAKKELGPKFDVRQFHDWVLGSGPMPLDVLARHVEWHIAQVKETPLKAGAGGPQGE